MSESQVGGVLNAFSIRRPTTLRANTLKIKASELKKELLEEGVKLEPVPWYRQAFVVKNKSLKKLRELRLYKQGFFYVQRLSSMVPPLVLSPKAGDKVLDICAAPGSKTTQMATMMENKGEIVANDISFVRLEKLKANLKIQGVTNVKVTKIPGQRIWQKYPEYFDRTLVDVFCSMEGKFSCYEQKYHKEWSLRKIKSLSKRQKWILRSAVSSTKSGGKIVYSSCTLSPEENEEVINWILEKEKGSLVVERINIPGFKTGPGLTAWRSKTFAKEIANTIRIFPSIKMEGFYVALLRKIKSTVKVV